MEVIPWLLENNGFRAQTRHVDVTRTVFAGGLPGNFTAIELAFALQDTFGPVEMVQFHTDRSQYPTGEEVCALESFTELYFFLLFSRLERT